MSSIGLLLHVIKKSKDEGTEKRIKVLMVAVVMEKARDKGLTIKRHLTL